MPINNQNKLSIFKGKEIRKTIYNDEWWFSVVDIVEVLTDSVSPRDYWYKMKVRVKSDDGFELSTICRQFKLKSNDGKMRDTDCANTEGVFVLFSLFRHQKQSRLKNGWQRLAMKE